MENKLNFTHEQLKQAAKAESAAALLALAQENGITLTTEEAATYYAQLHPETEAISDEELDNVFGGCDKANVDLYCKHCGSKDIYWPERNVKVYSTTLPRCRQCGNPVF